MRLFGNILWLIFGGLGYAIMWFISGCLWCITIIGIPLGRQCFKMAELVLSPFGKKVEVNFSAHPIANVIWFIFFGIWFFIIAILTAILFFITIIGIPFAKQWLKMAKLFLTPFGAKVS